MRGLQYQIHGALIGANVAFGVGKVVGALGLPATHPLAFAMVREFWAGLVLLSMSFYMLHLSKNQNQSMSLTSLLFGWCSHWAFFCRLGLMIFGTQAGFMVGLKMAGPVTASVWQPSQPIFTSAICMAMGLEPIQRKRLAGVLVAFLGCLGMVLFKKHKTTALHVTDGTTPAINHYLIGNAFFFCQCLCHSLYVILSKRMLALYPAVSVSAWTHNLAAAFLFLGGLLVSLWPNSNSFFCPECPPGDGLIHIAPGAIPALTYYIFFGSLASYGITFANQHATGTLVMSYSVLQPVTSSLLTTVLLVVGLVVNCASQQGDHAVRACLEFPSFGTFCGMAGVFTGLALIVTTEPHREEEEEEAEQDRDQEEAFTERSSEGVETPIVSDWDHDGGEEREVGGPSGSLDPRSLIAAEVPSSAYGSVYARSSSNATEKNKQ